MSYLAYQNQTKRLLRASPTYCKQCEWPRGAISWVEGSTNTEETHKNDACCGVFIGGPVHGSAPHPQFEILFPANVDDLVLTQSQKKPKCDPLQTRLWWPGVISRDTYLLAYQHSRLCGIGQFHSLSKRYWRTQQGVTKIRLFGQWFGSQCQ